MKIKLVEFNKIPSTNDYLKEKYQEYQSFTIVRADYQTKGKGQFDRKWLSSKGKNLLFSLLLKDVAFNQITHIKDWVKSSLFAAFGNFGLDVRFKEPNDFYVDDKKICGILIESKSNEDRFDYVIIGIGINVNQTMFNQFKATSILKETKKVVQVSTVLRIIMNNLIENYFG